MGDRDAVGAALDEADHLLALGHVGPATDLARAAWRQSEGAPHLRGSYLLRLVAHLTALDPRRALAKELAAERQFADYTLVHLGSLCGRRRRATVQLVELLSARDAPLDRAFDLFQALCDLGRFRQAGRTIRDLDTWVSLLVEELGETHVARGWPGSSFARLSVLTGALLLAKRVAEVEALLDRVLPILGRPWTAALAASGLSYVGAGPELLEPWRPHLRAGRRALFSFLSETSADRRDPLLLLGSCLAVRSRRPATIRAALRLRRSAERLTVRVAPFDALIVEERPRGLVLTRDEDGARSTLYVATRRGETAHATEGEASRIVDEFVRTRSVARARWVGALAWRATDLAWPPS